MIIKQQNKHKKEKYSHVWAAVDFTFTICMYISCFMNCRFNYPYKYVQIRLDMQGAKIESIVIMRIAV